MIIKIQVQNEEGNFFEFITLTGNAFKSVLNETPDKLLQIVEKMEERLPKPVGGSNYSQPDGMSLSMMTACGAEAR